MKTRYEDAYLGALKVAGILLLFAAFVQAVSVLLLGWTSNSQNLLAYSALYSVLGACLIMELRFTRYLAFLANIIGAVSAYVLMGQDGMPDWLVWIFVAIDLPILYLLACSIWRGRSVVE